MGKKDIVFRAWLSNEHTEKLVTELSEAQERVLDDFRSYTDPDTNSFHAKMSFNQGYCEALKDIENFIKG